MERIFSVSGKGRGLVSWKILILPILVVILPVSYQEAYGITYDSTLGKTGVSGNDNSHFNALIGTAVDLSGNIYVSDEDSQRVKKFDSSGAFQGWIGNCVSGTNCDTTNHVTTSFCTDCTTLGSSGSGNGQFSFPAGVAVGSGKIYVSDTDNHRVEIFDSAGVYQSTIGVTGVSGPGTDHFNFPSGIAVVSGKLYVVDSLNHRVEIFDSGGVYQSTINISSIPDEEQSGIAVDTAGNIYVSDTNNHRIEKFDPSGGPMLTIGKLGVLGCDSSHFNLPAGVAVDSLGNIYVVDSNNHRVQIFDFTGKYQSTIGKAGVLGPGTDQFKFPFGIAVDSSGRKIIVGDSFNFRVEIFSTLDGLGGLGSPSCPDAVFHTGDDPPPSQLKPSFGGVGNMVFPDGLTVDGKVYDLSKFAQEIPRTIADVGQPITIKIKEQLAHGPSDWRYVAVYMNFEGNDPETYNAHLVMSIDKNDGQKLVDPNGYIKNFIVTTEPDSTSVYTTFSFTAAKAMADSSMIVSAWDSHGRTNNVHVGGAIQFGQDPIIQPQTIPSWLHQYTNVHDADFAVENAGYLKPELFAHISNTLQLWNEPDTGHVLWFFDKLNGQVAILSYDASGNMIWHKEQILEKAPHVTTTTSYSGQHLDRNNDFEMKTAKVSEELKSLQTLERSNFHA